MCFFCGLVFRRAGNIPSIISITWTWGCLLPTSQGTSPSKKKQLGETKHRIRPATETKGTQPSRSAPSASIKQPSTMPHMFITLSLVGFCLVFLLRANGCALLCFLLCYLYVPYYSFSFFACLLCGGGNPFCVEENQTLILYM